uniref:Uncharacterized protein n=1 Tax=Solanum lycopersicum TaxID=4081 RepID=A0A3Q7IDN9_SOLLC
MIILLSLFNFGDILIVGFPFDFTFHDINFVILYSESNVLFIRLSCDFCIFIL